MPYHLKAFCAAAGLIFIPSRSDAYENYLRIFRELKFSNSCGERNCANRQQLHWSRACPNSIAPMFYREPYRAEDWVTSRNAHPRSSAIRRPYLTAPTRHKSESGYKPFLLTFGNNEYWTNCPKIINLSCSFSKSFAGTPRIGLVASCPPTYGVLAVLPP